MTRLNMVIKVLVEIWFTYVSYAMWGFNGALFAFLLTWHSNINSSK